MNVRRRAHTRSIPGCCQLCLFERVIAANGLRSDGVRRHILFDSKDDRRFITRVTPGPPHTRNSAMFAPVSVLAELASQFLSILASPAPVQQPLTALGHRRFYDVQVWGLSRSQGFYVLSTLFDS